MIPDRPGERTRLDQLVDAGAECGRGVDHAADPDYGEAHYALSFMLTQSDLERGRRHFERAMQLGVPDERNLRGQFYP